MISQALKNLAKELDVPVLALSQLSRAVESRGGDGKPMLSDLRESGAIEQDADLVGLLYKPSSQDDDAGGTETEGIPVNLLIAKQRHQAAIDFLKKTQNINLGTIIRGTLPVEDG